MTPAPSEPSELQNRLRQQLILAQVRIMELEDLRDTLAPKVTELEQLLGAAQTLADRKLDEAAHLEKVLADTRVHIENLQAQLQKITAELAGTRSQLTRAESDLVRAQHEASAHSTRRAQLETTLAAMKSTRSWKWTAWLRALGRIFSGKQA
jgi:chromosome segregation ATPase